MLTVRSYVIFYLIFFAPVAIFAQEYRASGMQREDPRCFDLAAATCSPGSYDDGTATVTTPNPSPHAQSSELNQKLEQAHKLLKSKFAELMRRQPFEYNRVATPLGLDAIPDCQRLPGSESIKEECLNRAANGLADLALELSASTTQRVASAPSMQQTAAILSSAAFQKVVEGIEEEFKALFPETEAEKKLPALFETSKALALDFVRDWGLDETTSAILTERMGAVQFAGTECPPDGGLAPLFTVNAMYSPSADKAFICRSFFHGQNKNESEFTLVFVLGHELAHSIDPCTIQEAGLESHRMHFGVASDVIELS